MSTFGACDCDCGGCRNCLAAQGYDDDDAPLTPEERWHLLTPSEQQSTLLVMRGRGGGFLRALAEAWLRADPDNAEKFAQGWGYMADSYGPGTGVYRAAQLSELEATHTLRDSRDILAMGLVR